MQKVACTTADLQHRCAGGYVKGDNSGQQIVVMATSGAPAVGFRSLGVEKTRKGSLVRVWGVAFFVQQFPPFAILAYASIVSLAFILAELAMSLPGCQLASG